MFSSLVGRSGCIINDLLNAYKNLFEINIVSREREISSCEEWINDCNSLNI